MSTAATAWWRVLGIQVLVLGAWIGIGAQRAHAGSHTWDVVEVFSDASGTVQFIELREMNNTPGETGLPGHTLSSNAYSFVIPGPALVGPTSGRSYLVATAAFAALPGAPTPDAIIPAGSVPFFSTGGDTLTYVPWDFFTFGPGLVPTDGINSLNRDLTTGPNTPKNYAGVTGSVVAPPPVPSLSTPGIAALVALFALAGCWFLARQRAAAAP